MTLDVISEKRSPEPSKCKILSTGRNSVSSVRLMFDTRNFSFSYDTLTFYLTEVGIFHSFAHGYGCQEKFNPYMTLESGLSTFEDCERLFSFTNRMAGVSRHTTEFHRHQELEWMITYWNSTKLAGLGQFQDSFQDHVSERYLLNQNGVLAFCRSSPAGHEECSRQRA